MPPQSWLHAHFRPYPNQGTEEKWHGSKSTGKTKIYCKYCWDVYFKTLKNEEELAFAMGRVPVARSDMELEMILWTVGRDSPYYAGRTSTHVTSMVNHLATKCQYVTPTVKAEALSVKQNKPKSPRKQRQSVLNHSGTAGPSGHLGHLAVPSSASPSARYSPYPQALMYGNFPLAGHIQPGSNTDSSSVLAPSDSISAIISRAPSRASTSLSIHQQPAHDYSPSHSVFGPPVPESIVAWNSAKKKAFEERIMRLTASAQLPLSWVDNPEFIALCHEYMPGSPRITRKTLTNRILRDLIAKFREDVRRRAKGQEVTMQGDGWTGLNNRHLVAFMASYNQEVHTVKVSDTTKDRKRAEELLVEIEDVYKTLQETWEAKVIALVTDASGDSRKARRIFAAKNPSLVVLDCYSHQINLVVGDFFKSASPLLEQTEKAAQLITWLRSKSRILAYLPLAVLRAVLTRWTAHYTAYRRLLELSAKLQALAFEDITLPEDQRVMITGDAAAQRKARSMVAIIKDGYFWHTLALIARYLEPLAIAANITQQSFCRLDQVLITFGYLVMKYRDPKMAHDPVGRDAIIRSIETRWAKADQEVFVAAVLCNPFYRSQLFRPQACFRKAEIQMLLTRLYIRFYTVNPPLAFINDAMDFLEGTGSFRSLASIVAHELARANTAMDQPDPLRVLDSFTYTGRPTEDNSPFIQFARRLLLISANSASCERLFSIFGLNLTKTRNRLSVPVLTSLSELKMHIRDDHLRIGVKARLKRSFQVGATHGKKQNPQERPPGGPPVPPPSPPRSVEEIINDILSGPTPMPIHTTDILDSESDKDDDELGNNSSRSPHAHTARPFSSLIAEHQQRLEEDNEDNDPTVDTSLSWDPLSIVEMFDFTSEVWTAGYARFAQFSFEEELNLYDLLEADADGEDDLDLGMDPATETVLIG